MGTLKTPLLQFLDEKERDGLFTYGKTLTLEAQSIFLKEDERNDSLYILLSGQVRVTKRVGEKVLILADLKAPTALGELTFLEPGLSSATCTTLEMCQFQVFSHEILDVLMEEKPALACRFLRGLALSLKERLLNTNEQVASYFDMSKELMDTHRLRDFYGHLFR